MRYVELLAVRVFHLTNLVVTILEEEMRLLWISPYFYLPVLKADLTEDFLRREKIDIDPILEGI